MSRINNQKVNRRQTLKTITGTVVGTALTGQVTAKGSGSKQSGVVYDPHSHKIVGEISGQYNQTQDKLKGNLRLDVPDSVLDALEMDRDRINVNKASKVGETEKADLEKIKYAHKESLSDSERPRYLKLSEIGTSVVGYIQHGRDKYAYSMIPQGNDQQALEEYIEETAFGEYTEGSNDGGDGQ